MFAETKNIMVYLFVKKDEIALQENWPAVLNTGTQIEYDQRRWVVKRVAVNVTICEEMPGECHVTKAVASGQILIHTNPNE